MLRTILVLLAVSLFAPPALAGERGGITMPDQIQVDGKPLLLNGMGIRQATFLNVDVYVAGLYLEERSNSAETILGSEQHKRLVLHFVRDVDREDMIDAWNEGFRKNAGGQVEALQERITKLNGWMRDISEGENMVFTVYPEKGVHIMVKGRPMGLIEGADFARAFLSIWLGPNPPNPGLKTGLLGLE